MKLPKSPKRAAKAAALRDMDKSQRHTIAATACYWRVNWN